ncbi:MAG: sulfur carrier protein ThiS [Planctomycetes bacterium]|nr:sulfur carrier protein ThiS [Planctomycetota bacterium]MCW8135808.1 sulfur carrier protein ThiS [Planctomycetota bacterium]
MKITVNGQEREVAPGTTLAQLVQQLNVRTDRIATERNLKVIPKAQYQDTVLEEGDKLEVVTFVGGG